MVCPSFWGRHRGRHASARADRHARAHEVALTALLHYPQEVLPPRLLFSIGIFSFVTLIAVETRGRLSARRGPAPQLPDGCETGTRAYLRWHFCLIWPYARTCQGAELVALGI